MKMDMSVFRFINKYYFSKQTVTSNDEVTDLIKKDDNKNNKNSKENK